MSGTLMEISAEFMRLHDMIVESEGELYEEAMAEIQLLLNKCDGKLNDKLDNYCALIRELEARAQIRTDEADRIRKRATMDRKASENLKRYLATGLEAMEMKSVDTPRFKITLGGTGGKQKLLLKEDQIPDKFWKDKAVIGQWYGTRLCRVRVKEADSPYHVGAFITHLNGWSLSHGSGSVNLTSTLFLPSHKCCDTL